MRLDLTRARGAVCISCAADCLPCSAYIDQLAAGGTQLLCLEAPRAPQDDGARKVFKYYSLCAKQVVLVPTPTRASEWGLGGDKHFSRCALLNLEAWKPPTSHNLSWRLYNLKTSRAHARSSSSTASMTRRLCWCRP